MIATPKSFEGLERIYSGYVKPSTETKLVDAVFVLNRHHGNDDRYVTLALDDPKKPKTVFLEIYTDPEQPGSLMELAALTRLPKIGRGSGQMALGN